MLRERSVETTRFCKQLRCIRNYVSDLCRSGLSLPNWSLKSLSFDPKRYEVMAKAITLVELVIVLAIVGTLAAIGVPSYSHYVDKARASQAIEDIYAIQKGVLVYAAESETLPENLEEAIWPRRLDPWGQPYEYLKIAGKKKSEIQGKWRKDHFNVPVNSDFDLYSMGKDGKSKSPFTAKASRDDIVRANDGAYVGLVSEY